MQGEPSTHLNPTATRSWRLKEASAFSCEVMVAESSTCSSYQHSAMVCFLCLVHACAGACILPGRWSS